MLIGSEPQRPYVGPLLSTEDLRGEAGRDKAVSHVFPNNGTELVAGRLPLVVAASPTSAQIPLPTWLPDAMAGPRPISALIHAATAVTAVTCLTARMHSLFARMQTAADIAAMDSGVPLLTVASIARMVTDPSA